MVSSILSRKTRHVNFCEQAVRLWRKRSLYADVLSHLNYETHGTVPTRHPWGTDEIDGIPRLTGTKKVYITMTMKMWRKESDGLSKTEDHRLDVGR